MSAPFVPITLALIIGILAAAVVSGPRWMAAVVHLRRRWSDISEPNRLVCLLDTTTVFR